MAFIPLRADAAADQPPQMRLRRVDDRLQLRINRKLAEVAGLVKGDRLAAALGVGMDAGRLKVSRLGADEAGGNRLGKVPAGHMLTVNFSLPQEIDGRSRAEILAALPKTSTPVLCAIEAAGRLVVTLPSEV